jgi:hypothetical protein
MTTAHSFAELTHAINVPGNPRIAAGMTPAQWDRKRRLERRVDWEVRSALAPSNPLARAIASTGCLKKNIPWAGVEPFAMQRPERGVHAKKYFAEKWKRLRGTLGEHETLNPYLDDLRRGKVR